RDGKGCQRCLGGGLEDDGAPCSEGRGDLPGCHRCREVPWGDEGCDSDGLLSYDGSATTCRRGPVLAFGSYGLLGKPAEELSGIGSFRARVCHGFAIFQGDESGKVL